MDADVIVDAVERYLGIHLPLDSLFQNSSTLPFVYFGWAEQLLSYFNSDYSLRRSPEDVVSALTWFQQQYTQNPVVGQGLNNARLRVFAVIWTLKATSDMRPPSSAIDRELDNSLDLCDYVDCVRQLCVDPRKMFKKDNIVHVEVQGTEEAIKAIDSPEQLKFEKCDLVAKFIERHLVDRKNRTEMYISLIDIYSLLLNDRHDIKDRNEKARYVLNYTNKLVYRFQPPVRTLKKICEILQTTSLGSVTSIEAEDIDVIIQNIAALFAMNGNDDEGASNVMESEVDLFGGYGNIIETVVKGIKPNRLLESAQQKDAHIELGSSFLLKDVWIQIDSSMQLNHFVNPEHCGIIGSVNPGTMKINNVMFLWEPNYDISNTVTKQEFSEMARNMTRGSQFSIEYDGDQTLKKDDQKLGILFTEIDTYTISPLKLDEVDRADLYCLTVFTTQVFRIFPIVDCDALRACLVEKLGMEPVSEHVFNQELGFRKSNAARVKIMSKLHDMGQSVFINNLEVLTTVMKELISPLHPQEVSQLELIYHSCRVNREVFAEALKFLKKTFAEKTDEVIRRKLLAIGHRLLERIMMRLHTQVFEELLNWIILLEGALDTYKCKDLLKIITSMRATGQAIHQDTIPMLDEELAPAVFENWLEFSRLRFIHSDYQYPNYTRE